MPIRDKSILELKGMFAPRPGVTVKIEDMRVKMTPESAGRDATPQVGHEPESPDDQRL